jgi:CHASE2 domain-containing sensor protein
MAAKDGPATTTTRQSVWRYLLGALPFIVVATALSTLLDEKGVLRVFETAALDRFLLLKERAAAPHVVIVAITDEDHQQLFGGKTSLDAATVYDIIKGIAKAEPKVIGVDLGTAEETYLKLPPLDTNLPIVWARSAILEQDEQQTAITSLFSHPHHTFVPGPVLGRTEGEGNIRSGISLAPVDSDRAIRRYVRMFRIRSKQPDRMDSFHWAVAKEYCNNNENPACEQIREQLAREDQELILNLSIDPYKKLDAIPARRLVGDSLDSEWRDETGTLRSPLKKLLKDKIVLLGGTYKAACDEHRTALGNEYGVELVAQAIESEFEGGDIRRIGELYLIALDLASGILFAILTYYWSSGWKSLLRITAIPVIAIGGSFIAFHSFATWANFVPILFSVYLHYRYEHAKEDRELRHELEEQVRVNKELRDRFQNIKQDKPADNGTEPE